MSKQQATPPWIFALAAMASVQLGSALSVGLIDSIGPAGTAWLRLSCGSLVFLCIARPSLRSVSRHDLGALLLLGVMTGLMTMMFLAAIERIPLGMAVSIEFLGPLTVAALRSPGRRALIWPAIALLGVGLLTRFWHGEADPIGIGFACLSGIGWGSYVVLTQHVGDRFSGLDSLSITVTIAALTSAILGVPQAAGNLTPTIVLLGFGLALLLPVLPFALELMALRRMMPSAFGTLMALEPAIGGVLGMVVLHQAPAAVQVVGILLVVLAGCGAQRSGRRVASAKETLLADAAAPG